MSISPGSIPSGSSQSKWYRREARGSSMLANPNPIPGHIRRPAPNGMNSKSVPLKSTSLFSNLSGMNSSGASQCVGSLPIAHAFTSTMVPAGTSKPRTRHVLRHSRGISSGAGGCSRSASLMTSDRSSSVTTSCPARTRRTSSCALRITFGFLISSAMIHCSVVADVSLLPPKISCSKKKELRSDARCGLICS
nr:unnamed protein product [Digitaria exilis]